MLHAAAVCLRRQGFEATTARDIAAEAGANLRSIGYHYGSTRELLLAAISANWRTWLAPLITATSDPSLRPDERLREGMELFVGSLEHNVPMVRAWLEAVVVAQHDSDLRAILGANQNEFQAALALTLAEAGHHEANARAAAIIDVCDGAIVRHLLHGTTPTPEAIARSAAAGFTRERRRVR